jgi:putative ATPase
VERLFDTGSEREGRRTSVPLDEAPLAVRMRPRTLDELVGQAHLLGEGSALRTAVASGEPHSMVLYGPPGSGKTTLARIVAAAAQGAFEEESAVNAGKAEVRAVITRAEERRRVNDQPTIFFLDEIHRFNKAQQDALLPAVEEGLVTLIGATTENPYFEVNSALLSRCQVYELRALGPDLLRGLLDRALADPERGIADPPPVSDEALQLIAERSGGDARTALAALERAVETARAGGHDVDVPTAEDALQRKALFYDREGDRHYDYISAWIKATRGSDPDASLYYLAVMLEGGEDPRYIARRMVILASEDIGNADPMALVVANAAAQAVDRVGLPECALNLGQAAAYLALAPKSNASTRGIGAAMRHVREQGAKLPPDYLRDAHYPGARKLGRGEGYVYPHDEPGGVAEQPLLPSEVQDERFYEPTDRGFEAKLRERLEAIRRRLSRN